MAQNETLPDLLADDLDVVFIGSAVGEKSARRGHYYSHPTNSFWKLLYKAGFTPIRLRPDQDAEVLRYGIGVGKQAAKNCGVSTTFHGHQRWTVSDIRVFVLPSSSTANSRVVIEGKTKVEWWDELRQLISAR